MHLCLSGNSIHTKLAVQRMVPPVIFIFSTDEGESLIPGLAYAWLVPSGFWIRFSKTAAQRGDDPPDYFPIACNISIEGGWSTISQCYLECYCISWLFHHHMMFCHFRGHYCFHYFILFHYYPDSIDWARDCGMNQFLSFCRSSKQEKRWTGAKNLEPCFEIRTGFEQESLRLVALQCLPDPRQTQSSKRHTCPNRSSWRLRHLRPPHKVYGAYFHCVTRLICTKQSIFSWNCCFSQPDYQSSPGRAVSMGLFGTYLRNSPSVSQVGTNLWQQMVPCPTNLQHHCNCVALCVAELLLLGLDLIIGQKPNFCSRNTLSKLLVWRGASLSWLLLTKDRDWLGSWWINAPFVCRILGWTISTIVMSQNSSARLQFFKTFFMLRWLSWALPFVP